MKACVERIYSSMDVRACSCVRSSLTVAWATTRFVPVHLLTHGTTLSTTKQTKKDSILLALETCIFMYVMVQYYILLGYIFIIRLSILPFVFNVFVAPLFWSLRSLAGHTEIGFVVSSHTLFCRFQPDHPEYH